MNTDITELASHMRGLAEAATPGQWMRLFGERTVYDRMEDGCRGIPIVRSDGSPPLPQDAANLDYIAAANPANIIRILDALEATQAEVARLREKESSLDRVLALFKEVQAVADERDEALARLADVVGCFHAAGIEGLSEVLANTTDERLKDLVERRLMYANEYAAAGASPVQPVEPPSTNQMTAERAAYFMRRFKRDEKLLGPNEQTAVDFVIALLEKPIQDTDPNAPWLSDAHMLCADQGIPQGHITDRIRALRDKLGATKPSGAIGYISAECLAKLNDPAWQELRGTPVNLWTINNPPSRAQIPVYASNHAPKGYDKTEMNAFVQSLYDAKIAEGRRGHYETMFHVVHQAIKRVQPSQALELSETEVNTAWNDHWSNPSVPSTACSAFHAGVRYAVAAINAKEPNHG